MQITFAASILSISICFSTYLLNNKGAVSVSTPFRHYIETHQVFTTAGALSACGGGASIRTALSRAVADGRIAKVRNGLYVSHTGRFIDLKVDPYRVAATFDPAAVFSFHSALELHGLAHSISNRVQFRSQAARLSFTFDDSFFTRYPMQESVLSDAVQANSFGTVSVTTREQTFLDCMNHLRLCGGAEEVLHSLAGLPYLHLDVVVDLLGNYPASVVARAGWYLEANAQRWNVSATLLDGLEKRLARHASYYLDSTARKGAQAFSTRWKLNLPATTAEIASWMEL
ncbi:MAG: hypothetical protein RR477_08050 [Raoultibacter sp.]